MSLTDIVKYTNLSNMTKSDAINLIGTTQQDLAVALGVTKSAISQWPDILDQEREDRVIGAAVRLGKIKKRAAA